MSMAAIYSVVNSKRKCQDDVAQGEDVVYTKIKFPDSLCPQNVSHDGKAGKEKPGSHPHPYRLTVVCLLLLCFFLIICIIVLSICLHRANWKYSMMEGDLVSDNNQLKINYSALTTYNNDLQKNYSITAEQKDGLQNDNEALKNKLQRLNLFCGTTVMQKPCQLCPQGWELFNSSCYFISLDQKSWMDSRTECQKWGADLVIIESKEEQDFIMGKNENHWIGLKYNAKKGWIWLDDTPLTGFPEPSPYHRNGYCVRRWETKWEGWTCNTKAGWICETRALLLIHL